MQDINEHVTLTEHMTMTPKNVSIYLVRGWMLCTRGLARVCAKLLVIIELKIRYSMLDAKPRGVVTRQYLLPAGFNVFGGLPPCRNTWHVSFLPWCRFPIVYKYIFDIFFSLMLAFVAMVANSPPFSVRSEKGILSR